MKVGYYISAMKQGAMSIYKKIIAHIQKRPFFFVLIGILAVISVVSIKPGFYLMGWDNYSSFFNQPTNIWRWFFHSWREFRGLGVPSDSEITELPRQLFFLILSPFVQEQLLEQMYFLLSFSAGGILTYILFTKIIQKYKHLRKYQDIGGFVAALFYVFNLNTLAVFYFPITPYITRFYAIPLLFLAFHIAVTSQHISTKKLITLILAVVASAPSFVIGTVFITMSMALGVYGIFQKKLLKSLMILFIFGVLNSYWLLPFGNYTLQKSKILPLAPTFISANETQLNKPASFYSAQKQIVLMPNFFETTVTNIGLDAKGYLHPLANISHSSPIYLLLFLFPICYILGSIILLVRFKTYQRILWIPSILFLFLFLSLKEYSPFGFVYEFFSQYIPFFKVIFRFGDTKFHPFIAFAGSLASGFAFVYGCSLIDRHIKKGTRAGIWTSVIVLFILIAVPYRWYFSGDLVGFFMYNKLPKEYQEIATIINNDPLPARVLHLPYDDEVYWRSYSWGYVGSSFFHYLLDKPFFEKTFEPASMENAYAMEKIQSLLHNSQSLQGDDLEKRALEFYELMKKLGIKYIILDGTVSTAQPTRGMMLWGSFNYPEARTLLQALEKDMYVKNVYQGGVKISEYMNLYEKRFPVRSDVETQIQNASPEPITLFELQNTSPKVQFLDKALPIDRKLKQELLVSSNIDAKHTISQFEDATYYPFLRTNITISQNKSNFDIDIPNIANGEYNIQTTDNFDQRTYLLEMVGQIKDNAVIITPYLHYFPSINNTVFRSKLKPLIVPIDSVAKSLKNITSKNQFLSGWSQVPQKDLTDLRIKINDTILPVPELSTNESSLGFTIIDSPEISIDILNRNQDIKIDTNSIRLTENPNCFSDALEGYENTVSSNNAHLIISSKNGSTCFWKDLQSVYEDSTAHVEIEVALHGVQENLDAAFLPHIPNSSKPKVTNYINSLDKPNTLQICIKEHSVDDCYNTHQLINLSPSTTVYRIPTTQNIQGIPDMLVFFALKNTQYQKQSVTVESFTVHSYSTVAEEDYQIEVPSKLNGQITIDNSVEISMPFTLSNQSYSYNKHIDMLSLSNNPCQNTRKSYRTFRSLNGSIISFVQNCQNQLFSEVPFSSNGFYLWTIKYNLASGKYPEFVLNDGLYSYKNEVASMNQGYPYISSFKKFQQPENIFNSYPEINFKHLPMVNAFTYIYPHPDYRDNKMKQYTFQQFSENEGIIKIDDFSIVELPNYWTSLKLSPVKKPEIFQVPKSISYESILPALKKITIVESNSSGKLLLKFNEGYDRQWRIHSSLIKAFLGFDVSTNHARCDGYANCFQLPEKYAQTGTVLYLLYWPETLNFIGWALSFLTMIGLFARRKPER